MPTVQGFIHILAKEGYVLGRFGADTCKGRKCFAVVRQDQIKERQKRRSDRAQEAWDREHLQWVAIPDDMPREGSDLVYGTHLENDTLVDVDHDDGWPIPAMTAIRRVETKAEPTTPALFEEAQ